MASAQKVVIIGNGISGTTAARFIRKMSNHQIVMISEETDHFFSRTALMYIYMGHMKYEHTKPYEDFFWDKNRIELLKARVDSIDYKEKKLTLSDQSNSPNSATPATLHYDFLILATGSKSNKFGWPGQDLKGVNGLYSYQDLQYMEKFTHGIERGVVVGGGLIGVEMVEMLQSRKIPVSFLVREPSFYSNGLPKEEGEMVGRHILKHGVDLQLSTELKEIVADENGRCKAVITKNEGEIPCQFVGLTVGVHPNIEFLKESALETAKGILVNEHLQTNIEDVYAVGDCAELKNPPPGRRPIEPIWYTGRIMGETVAYNICKKPVKYNPGIWFNSAKFFDIEYQVYGDIPPILPDEMDTLYWEDPKGRRCIRLNYHKSDQHLLGINVFGIRFRQEVCERWLAKRVNIREVLQNLSAASFDPELTDHPEREILKVFEEKTGEKLKMKSIRGWKAALQILKS